jgi:two-component system sensor histidine kinase MprB
LTKWSPPKRTRKPFGHARLGRTITIETKPCVVVGRPEALARALSNMIDNAVKFSPEESTIEVMVRGGRVEVRDHGSGIAPEDLPRVFDRFYRSEAARSQPGSGLGLAIVRHVAESHGGRAFAANHPDGGALIGIELPIVTSPPTSPSARDASQCRER